MSEASERGRAYEVKIQKLTARILEREVKRDGKSGAGWLHKEDIRDRYGELPISVEVKNQESLKLKEWWRDADDKASVGQAPIVVFPMDSEDLCIMRYSDLLNIVKEGFDWKATADDLRVPTLQVVKSAVEPIREIARLEPAKLVSRAGRQCPEGHIMPIDRDRCMGKGCKFSATYKKPKEKIR